MKCSIQSKPPWICTSSHDTMFKFKTPSRKTKELMSKVALGNADENYEELCKSQISDLTGHEHVRITSSGNNSIFIALSSVKGDVIVPDEGGWHGFKQIAKFLNKELIMLKTDSGLIDPKELDNIEFKDDSALIFTSFAGYTAEQDVKAINAYCNSNGITTIEDASAGIGDKNNRLGKHSDIIIASTGSPKIINVGSGGIISTSNADIFNATSLPQKLSKTNEIICSGIYAELENVSEKLELTLNATKHLKNNIENALHAEKRGVNIIIPHSNPKEISWKLRQNLPIDKSGFITSCPNYNRVKQKAIAIEIKNLDWECLKKEYLDEIITTISNLQQV